MVAKITFPKVIETALNYNEAKVRNGKAVCLQAVNFLKEAREMNFYQKLEAFRRLNDLNERATTKTIHISLNFDPSERLSDSKLKELANAYMDKIGFGDQPFLIYKHEDAGHPHIHIVSNTIRYDGSRINTHNIGRNQSEKARKELEQDFGLVKAGKRTLYGKLASSAKLEKAMYGKHETKQSISNAVTLVFNQYRFTSLPEYNAALRQLNVIASQGKEDGRIYRNKGLLYRILNEQGNEVGVPIKASSLYCQPTLKNLEMKFTENATARERYKERTKKVIEIGLNSAQTINAFVAHLEQNGVYAVLRENAEGLLYGMTYVDNERKCVFNGSDLGKAYSAASIDARFRTHGNDKGKFNTKPVGKDGKVHAPKKFEKREPDRSLAAQRKNAIADALLSIKEQHDNVPASLLNKKRKKKRRKDANP